MPYSTPLPWIVDSTLINWKILIAIRQRICCSFICCYFTIFIHYFPAYTHISLSSLAFGLQQIYTECISICIIFQHFTTTIFTTIIYGSYLTLTFLPHLQHNYKKTSTISNSHYTFIQARIIKDTNQINTISLPFL